MMSVVSITCSCWDPERGCQIVVPSLLPSLLFILPIILAFLAVAGAFQAGHVVS